MKNLWSHPPRICGRVLAMAGLIGLVLGASAGQSLAQDTQPPTFEPLHPRPGTFGVERTATLTATLRDDTAVDPASIRLRLGETEPLGSGDPRLSWANSTLTFTPADGSVLGAHGETVTVWVSAADVWGNALAPVAWTFTLELETIINERVVLVGEGVGSSLHGRGGNLSLVALGERELVLAFSGPDHGLRPGDILVGLSGDTPYYRKVLALSEGSGGKRVTATTGDVSLLEVFDQASIRLRNLIEVSCDIPPLEWQIPSKEEQEQEDEDSGREFEVTCSERDGTVAAWLDGGFEIRRGAGGISKLTQAHARLEGTVALTTTVKLSASAQAKRSSAGPKLIPAVPVGKPVGVRIGWIPVIIHAEFELGTHYEISADAESDIEATSRVEQQFSAEVAFDGAEWVAPPPTLTWGWQKPEVTPTFNGRMTGRVALVPRLRLAVDSLVGIWATAEPSLRAGVSDWLDPQTLNQQHDSYLLGGLDGQVGYGFKAPFKKDWDDKPLRTFEGPQKPLWGSKTLRVSPDLALSRLEYGLAAEEYPVKYEEGDFLPGHGPDQLQNPPRVIGPGPCAGVGPHALWPSGGSDPLYSFVPKEASLEVRPRELHIEVNPATRTVGNPNPVFTAKFRGLVQACDSEADFDLSFETDADAKSPPGSYDIRVKVGHPNPNYAIRTNTGTLTVEQKHENLVWVTDSGAAFPRSTVDANGAVHIVSARAGGGVLYRRTTATGKPLTEVVEVFPGGSQPDVAVDPAGNVHVCALSQSRKSVIYARLDAAASVTLRKAFGPDYSIGVDVFETWGTSVAVYVSEVELRSVRIALLPSDGGVNPLIGLIYSTDQRASFDWSPPPLPGFSIGEIFNYIVMLGVQATLATPRIAPGGEWVAWYRLDAGGEDAGHGTVYRKWGTKPLPNTLEHLSLAVDGAGRSHFAWRETGEGHATIAWAAGSTPAGASLRRVAGMALDQGGVGPPELSADGGTVALAWAEGRHGADGSSAEIRQVKVAELQPLLRVTQIQTDVDLTGPVGLTRAGSAWRVAWVDDQGSELREAVLGWDASGAERLSGPRLRTSVATLADIGVVSGVAMPVLASRGDVWALAVAAGRTAAGGRPDVALYAHTAYGGVYGLSLDAKLWDQHDFRPEGTDDPIALHCDLDLLSRQEGNYQPVEGVVADGVTPLLFRLGGLPAGPLRLRIAPDWLAAQADAELLQHRLAVAGGFNPQGRGTWQPGLTHTFDPVTQGEELYVTLAGVALEELAAWPPLGAEQRLPFALELYRDRSGEVRPEDRIISIPFIVRKPPIVLVHGYNTDATKGWGTEFKRILKDSAGITDAVIPVNYGTLYHAGAPAELPGYYLNTVCNLSELRTILSEELVSLEDAFRRRWAMTRYDVVGHSQGGLLLRTLCANEFGSTEGFISERNFGRGRFRRVITVGSPHNGSRLAHYLSSLRSEIMRRRQSGIPGLGADQVYAILDWVSPNILQDKFDPFLETEGYIRRINRYLPTHPEARVHVISSVIDHSQGLPKLVFRALGLSSVDRLEKVVPHGKAFGALLQRSDGVVDYQSHFGGVLDPNLRTEMTNAIAHAEAWLYGAEHSQGDSPAIANRIAELLDGADSAGHFGRFMNPKELGPAIQARIDEVAVSTSLEAVGNLAELTIALARLPTGPGWLAFVATVALAGPDAPQLAGPTDSASLEGAEWMVRVYSPDPVAKQDVTWERSSTVPGGIEIHVPEGLQAQVVVLALASASSDGVAMSLPTVIYDTLTERIRALVIGGVPSTLARQGRYQASVLARLDDGGVSEFYRAQPEGLRWGSSDTNLVSISAVGGLQTGDRTGTTEITAQYGAWSGRQAVRVVDQMPEVFLITPKDGAVLGSSDAVQVRIAASDADGTVEKVVLYLDDQAVREWTQPPYVWEWPARRPGDHILRARVSDDGGGMRASLPVRVTVAPQAPVCAWVSPGADGWYSGALRLEGLVSDPDVDDTPSVVFEYSEHSSDGFDGEWLPCGAPVNAAPYVMMWQTVPRAGLDAEVWLRMRATDGAGLASVSSSRRIHVDNTAAGLLFDPHPGEDYVGLDRGVTVRFEARPASSARPFLEGPRLLESAVELRWSLTHCVLQTTDSLASPAWRSIPESIGTNRHLVPKTGPQSYFRLERLGSSEATAMTDSEIASAVVLRDRAGAAVPCATTVLEDGRMVRLQPLAPLEPRREYAIELVQAMSVEGKLLPLAASTFTTTFGSPAGLHVHALPAYPQAGEVWDTPVEVMVVDALGNRVENAISRIAMLLTTGAGQVLGAYDGLAEEGVARFRNVRTETAGLLGLTLTCSDLSLTNSAEVEVLPGPLASFQLEVAAQVQAGQLISVVASAYDSFGNLKTDYLGAPVLVSGDTRATLNSLPAFRASDRGRRSYDAVGTLRTLGDQWLQLYNSGAASLREKIRVLNAPPAAPEAIAPKGMVACGLAPRLTGSAFVDRDNASHGASQWQVAQDALFETLVWDSGEFEAGNSTIVPTGLLVPNQVYYWRVRYRDNPPTHDTARWSPWSGLATMQTARAFPFADDFSQDLGWDACSGGLWTRTLAGSLPAGVPGHDTSAGDDDHILTTAANGGPPGDLAAPCRIISPAVDCSAQTLVQLSFERWLDLDSADWAQAEVAVSVDRITWIPLWENGPEGVNDGSWQAQRFDITEFAAGQPTVYVGFSLGPQYQALSRPGWHIDDVRLENGVNDVVVASLTVASTNLTQGDEFECRILVREHDTEGDGFLGGAFDLIYDAFGLQLVSPADAAQVVSPPFTDVKTDGVFTTGRIIGLGGATLSRGFGNGVDVVFAALRFRAIQAGSFGLALAAGDAGCVVAEPIGLVAPTRVHCGPPLTLRVAVPPVVFPLEFRLAGPTNWIPVGTNFELQVAVRENHPQARGFLGGAVDLYYDEGLVEPVAPLDLAAIVNPAFQSLGILSGAIAESRIDELGGVTLTEGQAQGSFIIYLRVPFRAKRAGSPVFAVGPSLAGVILTSPVGQLAPEEVDWGTPLELAIGAPSQPVLNRPSMVGNVLELSWSGCEDCVLQTTDSLSNPVWRSIPETRGRTWYQVPMTGQQGYLRLDRMASP